MKLENKVAVVTGSARGIGREIAWALARAGAAVVITARNQEACDKVAEDMRNEGLKSFSKACDVSKKDDVAELVNYASNEAGGIDIWVNNAGITKDNLILRMKEEDWDSVIDINLKGTFLCSQAVSKVMMKKRYGKIINISSISGELGTAGQANYAASKGGMVSLTKVTAREFASRGIRVNAVSPGFIETEMTATLNEKLKDDYKQQIPLAEFGSTDDVANAVLFLASPESDYITGQVISVCGGMVM